MRRKGRRRKLHARRGRDELNRRRHSLWSWRNGGSASLTVVMIGHLCSLSGTWTGCPRCGYHGGSCDPCLAHVRGCRACGRHVRGSGRGRGCGLVRDLGGACGCDRVHNHGHQHVRDDVIYNACLLTACGHDRCDHCDHCGGD